MSLKLSDMGTHNTIPDGQWATATLVHEVHKDTSVDSS
jgi:hypothetical protein